MSVDPVSNLLCQLQNAYKVKKEKIKVPFSNFKFEILKVMKRKGAIKEVEKKGRKKKYLMITLNYNDQKEPLFSNFKRVSRGGQRIYLPAKKIKISKSGYGFFIISTSKGLKTDRECKRENVGGEVICEVW